jgi:hypothetical protein
MIKREKEAVDSDEMKRNRGRTPREKARSSKRSKDSEEI